MNKIFSLGCVSWWRKCPKRRSPRTWGAWYSRCAATMKTEQTSRPRTSSTTSVTSSTRPATEPATRWRLDIDSRTKVPIGNNLFGGLDEIFFTLYHSLCCLDQIKSLWLVEMVRTSLKTLPVRFLLWNLDDQIWSCVWGMLMIGFSLGLCTLSIVTDCLNKDMVVLDNFDVPSFSPYSRLSLHCGSCSNHTDEKFNPVFRRPFVLKGK